MAIKESFLLQSIRLKLRKATLVECLAENCLRDKVNVMLKSRITQPHKKKKVS